MKNKWLLFSGLALLTAGVILKLIFENSVIPVILIITGIVFKIYFIINKIIRTSYKPGYELFFLAIGLALFISGMYLKNPVLFIEPVCLKIVGLLFKLIFVFLFIQKTKSK
jgi:hypothetical protein